MLLHVIMLQLLDSFTKNIYNDNEQKSWVAWKKLLVWFVTKIRIDNSHQHMLSSLHTYKNETKAQFLIRKVDDYGWLLRQ